GPLQRRRRRKQRAAIQSIRRGRGAGRSVRRSDRQRLTAFGHEPSRLAAAAPVVLEGRYRLLLRSLARLRRSRRSRWAVGLGYGVVALALALLAFRHFRTTGWPLTSGRPGLLAAGGVLLLLAQGLKALGWARLFGPDERPSTLALAAGNGGAALVGVIL